MTFKRSWIVVMAGILLLILSLLVLCFPSIAFAQCGEPPSPKSSCLTCHQAVLSGEWHAAHASQDLCLDCHGGNGTSTETSLAHQGMVVDPLADVYTDCHRCHPDNYNTLGQRFAAALGSTVGSRTPPTPVPAEPVSYHDMVVRSGPPAGATPPLSAPNLIFDAAVLVFGLGLAVTLFLRRL